MSLQWAEDKPICRRGNLNIKNEKKIKGIQSHWKLKLKSQYNIYNFIVTRLAEMKRSDNIKCQ